MWPDKIWSNYHLWPYWPAASLDCTAIVKTGVVVLMCRSREYGGVEGVAAILDTVIDLYVPSLGDSGGIADISPLWRRYEIYNLEYCQLETMFVTEAMR